MSERERRMGRRERKEEGMRDGGGDGSRLEMKKGREKGF